MLTCWDYYCKICLIKHFFQYETHKPGTSSYMIFSEICSDWRRNNSLDQFAQHIIQNSKIFFSLLYTELIKNSFFDNTRPVLGLRIWHQKKKEKYPKSKYMLYIQIPKTITNCQIIIPKFSSHEDPSILKIYWAQNAYLHLPI